MPSKNLRRSFILRDYSEGRFGRLMLCLLAFRNRAVDWDDTDRRIAFDGDKLVPGFECRFPAQVLERLCRRGAIEMKSENYLELLNARAARLAFEAEADSHRADTNAWDTAHRASAFEGTAAASVRRDRSLLERQTSVRFMGASI